MTTPTAFDVPTVHGDGPDARGGASVRAVRIPGGNMNDLACTFCGAQSVLELLNDDGTSQLVCRPCALREDAELVGALDGEHPPGCPGAPAPGSSEDLFTAADAEIAEAVERSVARAGGDGARAFEELLGWIAAGGPERELLAFQSTRRRVGLAPSPMLERVLAGAAAESGGDEELEERLVSEAIDPIEQPTTHGQIVRELETAGRGALRRWVEVAARRWREARSA